MKELYSVGKFLLAAVAFSVASSALGSSLDHWTWRNPLPNGNPQSLPHTLYGMVYTNGLFLAVGDAGTVSISADATNWTESATATSNQLNSVIYAGGKYVAVGDGGAVETSTNGTNWLLRTSGTTNSLSAITCGNGTYLAVGAGGTIIASPDAVSWSPRVSGTNIDFTGVTYGGAGFVAIGELPYNDKVFLSSDGVVWTNYSLTTGTGFLGEPMMHDSVAYTGNAYWLGSHRYSASLTAQAYIFSSSDGINWITNSYMQVFFSEYGFGYDFFVIGNGTITAAGTVDRVPFLQSSSDGTNWTWLSDAPAAYGPITSGAYGNGNYVITAGINNPAGITLPPIYTSTDGLNWVNQQHPPTPPTGPTNTFTSIALSNGVYVVATSGAMVRSTNGLAYATVSNTPSLSAVISSSNGFFSVGSAGQIYQSSDGISWTQRNSATANNLYGITAGNGLLVAVGDNGAIQTSPTGVIWTSRLSGTSLQLYSVTCSNGLFVAVGQMGTVLTSPDGINWTGQDSGQLTNLMSVTYGSAGFVAVGPEGTILTSPDGVNWTEQNAGTQAALESVTYGNGYYVVTGDNATVLTSPDGATWTLRNVGATGGQNLYGSAFLNGRFDVVGSGGAVIESDPLFDVQIHRSAGGVWLTVLAPPGSNFRIQTCTNLAAPVWTDAASFSNAPAIVQWTNNAAGPGPCFYRSISP